MGGAVAAVGAAAICGASGAAATECRRTAGGAIRVANGVAIIAVANGMEQKGCSAVVRLQRSAAADRDIGAVESLRGVAVLSHGGRGDRAGSHGGEESCELHLFYSIF